MFYISQNRALRDRGEMRTLRRSSSAAPAVKGGKEEEEGIVGGCIPIYSSTSLSLFPGGWEQQCCFAPLGSQVCEVLSSSSYRFVGNSHIKGVTVVSDGTA